MSVQNSKIENLPQTDRWYRNSRVDSVPLTNMRYRNGWIESITSHNDKIIVNLGKILFLPRLIVFSDKLLTM